MTTLDSTRITSLRQKLLERRLRGEARPARPAPAPLDAGGPAPLSHGQQRLWFLDRLVPGGAEYAVPMALRLTGELDLDALRRALDTLVRRHPALRTVYRADNGQPHQVVLDPAPVELPVVDLTRPGSAATREVMAGFVARPLDLSAGPVLRAMLIREVPDRHVLVLNVHHIACDGWSLPILVRDLRAGYEGTPTTPQLACYTDFARRQRAQDVDEADVRYWRRRLAGLETMEMPTDRPRAAVRLTGGAAVPLAVPADVATTVTDVGRACEATPFMTLLAVTQFVLGRHTRRTDVAVGAPVAGRDRREYADIVGFFVNTVIARTDLSGDPTFRELVARVREDMLRDMEHHDVPFEALVRAAEPDRDLAHTPLFQVMFALYEADDAEHRMGPLAMTEVPVPVTTAKCDLTIALTRQPDGSLSGSVEYATALFDRDRMTRLARHIEHLLAAVATNPDAPCSRLDILPSGELDLLLREWNDTATAYRPGCLHDRIASQARRTPGAVAVRCADEEITYAELDAWSSRIARQLRQRGVGPETPVGVLCERGIALLPALLGVLRTGGHYVPLDPAYPAARQEFMLARAGASVLVTTARFRDRHPAVSAVVYADDRAADAPAAGPDPVAEPDNLAYVIYTSGSTGQPKGVMITHRGVLHYLDWCYATYRPEDGDGAPVHSSLAFDLTVTGLFLPLLAGRTVFLVPEDEHPVAGLAAVLSNGRRFSFVKLTPAHLEPLRSCLPPEAAAAAHHLVVGGEQLTAEALTFWRENAPDVVVANEYGHTETSVANVIELVPAGNADTTPVSIGRPIWNTRVYLCDEDLRPVPVGVVGELYAGGAGVARGLVGRPGLTAGRYIPNPFGAPGERLYRSGDLARYLPDGRLEFVGRTDHQVKVRGYRVELGEIEAALVAEPAVTEAVVVVREGALASYVSPAGVDVAEVRAHLMQRLPGHLVPTTLTALARLPLTDNGKIDRTALPEPNPADVPADRVEPRDELELSLVRLWSDVLGAPVGVTDNFFACGGHSLLAVTMVDRARNALNLELSLSEVFQAPTIRQLGDRLRDGSGDTRTVVPLSPGQARQAPLFLVPPTAGTPFPYLPLVQRLGLDLPVYGLRAAGYGEGERPLTTIEDIAARYLSDLRRIFPHGPLRVAGWSMGGSVGFEMARQWEAAGEPVGYLGIIDSSVLGADAISDNLAAVPTADLVAWFGQAVLRLTADDLDELSPRDAMRDLLAKARHQGMVSDVADADVVRRMAGVYLANKMAVDSYRCTAVVRADIHLIRARDAHPDRGRPQVRPQTWREHTSGALHDTLVEGNHWSIAEEPHVAGLASALTAGLASNAAPAGTDRK
jgi:amino acid adenylation domain-containing protein